jgi:hypothetical protein
MLRWGERVLARCCPQQQLAGSRMQLVCLVLSLRLGGFIHTGRPATLYCVLVGQDGGDCHELRCKVQQFTC